MANERPADFVCPDFVCPECQARYKLVHVHSPSPPAAASVQCRVCGHSFASTDGEDILKYFLVDRPGSAPIRRPR